MKIRQLETDDVVAVVELWRAVFPEYVDPSRPQRDPRASAARKLALADGLFWGCEVEGRLVATAMAGWDGHRGWLYSVGVDPAWRGRGIAARLVEHAEAELKRLGCPKLNLQVLESNHRGRAFWRALGYELDEVVSLGKRL